MAESWVATDNDRFLDLEITPEQRTAVRDYLDRVREQRRSRKPQGFRPDVTERMRAVRAEGRPVVFYAGENPYRSGILPSNMPRARRHSPHYRGTEEALDALCAVAAERGWHIVFKPHPQARSPKGPSTDADTLTLAEGANVFECILESDVTTTLVSQVSYLALIQDKPCVLMGRNPLSGKGCVYEVACADSLAPTFEAALAEGLTPAQREAWLRHATQLCVYYLFALEPEVEEALGRDVRDAARFVLDHARTGDVGTPPPVAVASGANIGFTLLHTALRLATPAASLAAAVLPERAKRRVDAGDAADDSASHSE